MKMLFTILQGYFIKNKSKFLIMIFAITLSTSIIFGTTVARKSQSKYVIDEINRQSPNYEIEVGNIDKEDMETIERDSTVKSVITQKYYGQVKYGQEISGLEEFNNKSFEKLKHTLISGRFPQKKNEIIINEQLFDSFKKNEQKNSKNLNENQIELRYIKEYLNNNNEHEIFDQTNKFKIVGIYKMTEAMAQVSEGQGVYVYKNFQYPNNIVSYNAFVDLKSGTSEVQKAIDSLSLKLKSGQLNMQINKSLNLAKQENAAALSSFNLFDTGTIIASAFIIFNVFNIMMKEMINQIGLLRVVGMSKKQSLIVFMVQILFVLIIGSLLGFMGGYFLAKIMLKYFHLSGVTMDISKAPIYISNHIITKTLRITVSILLVSTALPIISTLRSYPINMMRGNLRSPFDILDEFLCKIKKYVKFKLFILNISNKLKFKLRKYRPKKNITKTDMKTNIAIRNSKRNAMYILSTAVIVGMSGLYGVTLYITSQDDSNIGDTMIQRLGDYDIDLSSIENSNLKSSDLTLRDVDNIYSIKGVTSVYTSATETGYIKVNSSDLSDSYRKNLSIDKENEEREMRFDIIGLNNDALSDILKNNKNLIENGKMFKANNDIVEAIVYNNFFDLEYSGEQKPFSENLQLGNILDLKIAVENQGKLQYKPVQIKIVGFLSKEWFTIGSYTGSKIPDILLDSKDYAKLTRNNNFSQIKIRVDKTNLESVKTQIKSIFYNRKNISYEDKSTIQNENDKLRWQVIVRNIFNSSILAITAMINIIFSIITSIAIRKREFGIMRAVGLSIKNLKSILLIEGLIYGIVSSILGFLLIFYRGVTWASLIKTVARLQNVPYNGSWYILPKIPILIFVSITLCVSLLSVVITFSNIDRKNIVNQLKED